ncbi:hypothetical protein [Hyalangium versicolor]|uniref:hypothetical protein n=1 Tax=Hyalangium versicolor TaxID=2861190 RepID=UPI001CCADF07|nr:hypothetical protein [Hyalangium versicolor]
MLKRLCWTGFLWLLGGLLGCATPNPNVRVRRLPEGQLEVDGPLAGPFETLGQLAAEACELMMNQPGASNRAYGFEYCALHYYSVSGGGYFLSYLSNIGGDKAGGTKYCEMPRALRDPMHGDAVLLGGDHTHPYPQGFSKRDTSSKAHWNPVRFVDPVTHQLRERQLMVFFRDRRGTCKAYNYNNATRVVTALRDGQWVSIGQADDDGDIKLFEGMEWLE